jgi:hypothetical protein
MRSYPPYASLRSGGQGDALHPAFAVPASQYINGELFQRHRGPQDPAPTDGFSRDDSFVGDTLTARIGFLDFGRFRDVQLYEFRIGRENA